jgi:hypothetical protein
MPARIQLRRAVLLALTAVTGVLTSKGVQTFMEFRPAAITLGPGTTIYFNDEPSLVTRVHEAIHRRQMRDKSFIGRLANAVRYNFDYQYRLDEEAEAKAGEICLQIHKFSDELPAYTTARSRAQAEVYRAWAWERIGPTVPDRVGDKLQHGERCHEILAGVTLDLPPGEQLTEEAALKLAAFRFLQSWGSTDADVAKWKARLELAGLAEPTRWVPGDTPRFWLVDVAAAVAPAPDTTITAAGAGEALHRLTYYRANRMYLQLVPTIPSYRHTPLVRSGEDENRLGMRLARWPTDLLGRALHGALRDDEADWLAELDAHPLHGDFELFARAPEADIFGTRYQLPVAGGWDRLVPTELEPVREAFQAQWGRAALAVHRGDLERADEVLRSVVGGALQMVRNAPFEVDVVEALGFLHQALHGLAALEEARGNERPAWAAKLDEDLSESWMGGHRASLFSEDAALVYHSMPFIVKDRGIPRAFKRFAYTQVVLFDVCLGLRQDRASRRELRYWRDAVEAGLVARESDALVLDMMRGSVQELLLASDVTPETICAPSVVVRPQARFAIMSAPLRSMTPSYPPLIAGDFHHDE